MVICEHCHGAVDVVMRDGAALRCGCGKTHRVPDRDSPQAPAAPETNMPTLELVLRRMVQYKARRVKVGDLEVELSPEAFAPMFVAQDATPPPAPPDEQCTCGHPLHDHTQAGCVMGCDIETCGRAEAS